MSRMTLDSPIDSNNLQLSPMIVSSPPTMEIAFSPPRGYGSLNWGVCALEQCLQVRNATGGRFCETSTGLSIICVRVAVLVISSVLILGMRFYSDPIRIPEKSSASVAAWDNRVRNFTVAMRGNVTYSVSILFTFLCHSLPCRTFGHRCAFGDVPWKTSTPNIHAKGAWLGSKPHRP